MNKNLTYHKVVIKTKRFLRKPKMETFIGAWNTENEVKTIIARFHPNAEIVRIKLLSKEDCAYYEEQWLSDKAKDCRKIDCVTCAWNDGYFK
jgi:hypothetical protein